MSDTDDNTTQERTPTPREELGTLLEASLNVREASRYQPRHLNVDEIRCQVTQQVTRSKSIYLSDYISSGYTDIQEYCDYHDEDWDDEDIESVEEGDWQITNYVHLEDYNNLVKMIHALRKNLTDETGTIRVQHTEVA
jgi:hypothetical protein